MRGRVGSLFLFLCLVSLAAGCHWFRFGRKKRSTQAEAQLTEVWRVYFAVCLNTKVSADPALALDGNTQNWQTNVDYTILQSVWYVNVDQWHCSSAAGQDTAQCWKSFLAQYLRTGSAVLRYSQECVDEFVEDTQVDPPNLRYFNTTGRKKRGISNYFPFPTTNQPPTSSASPQQGYTSCLRSNGGRIPGTDPLDYDGLSRFIREYTVFGCEACGDACADQPTVPPGAPPQWPYRFLALSRTDAPIRNAISECNEVFFPGDPFWSEWSPYSPASCPPCGSGIVQVRTRTCRSGVDPTMQVDDSQCVGSSLDRLLCQIPPCLPPSWEQWGPWEPPCPPCGEDHFQTRQRVCRSQFGQPLPDNECPGPHLATQACNIQSCRPNEWGTWFSWSPTCPPCGPPVVQSRDRFCHDPTFNHILAQEDCPGGLSSQEKTCYPPSCNEWGDWGRWNPPCPSCATRPIIQRRRRFCRNANFMQVPNSNCPGLSSESQPCNVPQCDPIGDWGMWGSWSVCSEQCSRRRSRPCFPPTSSCTGHSEQSQSCQGGRCPQVQPPAITYYWGSWGNWGQCGNCVGSVEGLGSRNRTRDCLYLFFLKVPDILCILFPGGGTQNEQCRPCW